MSSSEGEASVPDDEMSRCRDGMSTSEGVLKALEMERAPEEMAETRTTRIASHRNRGGMLIMVTAV